MTEAEFYIRSLIAVLMLIGGSLGVRLCNISECRKHSHIALQSEYKSHNNTNMLGGVQSATR